jgi:hypothetical protein
MPFIVLLVLTWWPPGTASITWRARPRAQPVPFAFGGEASPTDYARAIADGGLLALIACLGLAQLSHETTPALAQLGFTALTVLRPGGPALPHRWPRSWHRAAAGGLASAARRRWRCCSALGGARVLTPARPA